MRNLIGVTLDRKELHVNSMLRVPINNVEWKNCKETWQKWLNDLYTLSRSTNEVLDLGTLESSDCATKYRERA
jgi:hypothetical protein